MTGSAAAAPIIAILTQVCMNNFNYNIDLVLLYIILFVGLTVARE